MLEKQKGVQVAMPFAELGVIEVWTSKKGALTPDSARKVIEAKSSKDKFLMLAFDAQTPAAALTGQVKKKKAKGKKKGKGKKRRGYGEIR